MTTTTPTDPLNPTLEGAAEIVSGLVKDFQTNERYYLSASYHEADVRKDFIDKLFITFGWDVNHDIQKNPFQQEVKVERNVQVATAQRRADYALSLAPHFDSPVLYIEAKKPCDDVATADNYFQTIRYANQRGHAIGILTSFAQIHVVDCRYQANIDTAVDRCLRKYEYGDLADRDKFAEVFFLFSRRAITEGSIERFTETLPKPKGRPGQKAFFPVAYKAIDEQLPETLDDLRRDLARALKNRNAQLDSLALTELTQRILDRLVFIRFLEDKLIEPVPIIPTLGKSTGRTAWQDFLTASPRLDTIYNGIVFRKHPTLDDPDTVAKAEVVKTLGRIGPDLPDAIDFVIAVVRGGKGGAARPLDAGNPPKALRQEAIVTLGTVGPKAKKCIPILLEIVNVAAADIVRHKQTFQVTVDALSVIGVGDRRVVSTLKRFQQGKGFHAKSKNSQALEHAIITADTAVKRLERAEEASAAEQKKGKP